MTPRPRGSGSWPRDRWVIALAAALACLPLLKVHGYFWIDWTNHLWMSGYVGRYFRVHHSMPAYFNTQQHLGMANPMFYGFLFYPSLGLLTSVISPDLLVRLLSPAALYIQGDMIRRAFGRVAGSGIATAIAVLVTWQIYPLTNLYNRGALTEFAAVVFLTCALATWMLLLTEAEPVRRVYRVSLVLLLLVLTVATHPISGVYGCLFLGLVALLTLPRARLDRGMVVAGAVSCVLGLAVVAPWIYVTSRFRPLLHITTTPPEILYFRRSLDAAWSRFSPLPVDRRTFETANLFEISTPYLDAQMSVPLLVVALALGWVSWRASRAGPRAGWPLRVAVGTAWALFLATAWVSISPKANHVVPPLLRMVQFAYRLVSYQNLALLLALYFGFWLAPRAWNLGESTALRRSVRIALAIAALALPVKLWHALRIAGHDPGIRLFSTDHRATTTLNPVFYAQRDYTTPSYYGGWQVATPEMPRISLPVRDGSSFGVVSDAEFVLDRPARALTNVSAFPLHHLIVDGVEVPPARLIWTDLGTLAFDAPAGRHRISVRTDVDGTWVILTRVSWLAMATWLALIVWLRQRRAPDAHVTTCDSTDGDGSMLTRCP